MNKKTLTNMAKNKTINIKVIINTTHLMKDFPTPIKDQSTPTNIAHDYQYMVASDNVQTS